MNLSFRLSQAWTIAKLELRRVFFSKRSFWVYLLALFPTVIFVGHAIEMKFKESRWTTGDTTPARMESIAPGATADSVLDKLGRPVFDRRWRRRTEDGFEDRRYMMYFDGRTRHDLEFREGVLKEIRRRPLRDFDGDRQVFAGVFQYFYLRLAIFFGCLGIFMNLFRGEMLDKTLHFWLLIPARRETLLAGKYLAGLLAAVVIFTVGAALCFAALLSAQDPLEVERYWQASGAAHLVRYSLAATLACVGYGSVFLAAGMLLRNPIIPAVVLLLWEGINGFLPATLQKLSVLYYVQALCPIPAPMESGAPALIKLLLAPAAPPNPWLATLGLFALTALVLWAASRAVRRLEINYGTD